jgi:hypothetical protein
MKTKKIHTVTVSHTGAGRVVQVTNYSSERKAIERYKAAQQTFEESKGFVVQLFSEPLIKEAYGLGTIK